MNSQAFLVKDLSVLAHSFSSTPKDQWEENVTSFSQRALMQQQTAGKYSDLKKKNQPWISGGWEKTLMAGSELQNIQEKQEFKSRKVKTTAWVR